MSKHTGGPAFPSTIQYFPDDKNANEEQGMTLRDYFAAKAMQGMLAAGENHRTDEIALYAYDIADGMLKERGKE
jgi:hypothetical protein